MSSHRAPHVKSTVTPPPAKEQATEPRERATFQPHAPLPLSNVSETARLVYRSLTALNAATMVATKRAKHLEAFRPSMEYATQHLTELFAHHALPLPRPENNAAIMASELCIQMAHGYKKLAADLLATKKSRQTADKIVVALYRAVTYLYRFHLSCYQRYAPIPETAWKELHQLYTYAEKHGLDTTNVSDREASAGHGTISDLYKQALLLYIANPYRLAPDQIRAVATFVETWAPQSDLRAVSVRRNDTKLFVVMLASSEAPMPWALCPDEPSTTWRSLDTSRLVGVMREFISLSEKPSNRDASANTLPLKTMQHLLRTFALASQRDATRVNKTVRLWITMGLSDTYLCINRGLGQIDPRRHSAIFPCVLINESASGACLLWKGDLAEKLRVGDVIGLYADENGGNRAQIAVIRWISNAKENVWMLGLQRLVDNAQAVAAKVPSPQGKSQRVMPSLLLPENSAANLPATLVLPTLVCRSGDCISVLRRGKEFNLQLAQVVETSATFTRFIVRGAATPTTTNSVTTTKVAPKRAPLKRASGF